jgi:hypothetical protein
MGVSWRFSRPESVTFGASGLPFIAAISMSYAISLDRASRADRGADRGACSRRQLCRGLSARLAGCLGLHCPVWDVWHSLRLCSLMLAWQGFLRCLLRLLSVNWPEYGQSLGAISASSTMPAAMPYQRAWRRRLCVLQVDRLPKVPAADIAVAGWNRADGMLT